MTALPVGGQRQWMGMKRNEQWRLGLETHKLAEIETPLKCCSNCQAHSTFHNLPKFTNLFMCTLYIHKEIAKF